MVRFPVSVVASTGILLRAGIIGKLPQINLATVKFNVSFMTEKVFLSRVLVIVSCFHL